MNEEVKKEVEPKEFKPELVMDLKLGEIRTTTEDKPKDIMKEATLSKMPKNHGKCGGRGYIGRDEKGVLMQCSCVRFKQVDPGTMKKKPSRL